MGGDNNKENSVNEKFIENFPLELQYYTQTQTCTIGETIVIIALNCYLINKQAIFPSLSFFLFRNSISFPCLPSD